MFNNHQTPFGNHDAFGGNGQGSNAQGDEGALAFWLAILVTVLAGPFLAVFTAPFVKGIFTQFYGEYAGFAVLAYQGLLFPILFFGSKIMIKRKVVSNGFKNFMNLFH